MCKNQEERPETVSLTGNRIVCPRIPRNQQDAEKRRRENK
jgi:hypothetical protein